MTSSNGRGAVDFEFFIDYLLPELKPYEVVIYLYLLRRSHLSGTSTCRVGKRTLAAEVGVGSRSEKSSYSHISDVLSSLKVKGCIHIADTNREGTLYAVVLPTEVQAAIKRHATAQASEVTSPNYFEDPERRRELFERDHWMCQYCGDRLTAETATLDHYVPQCQGGSDLPENLRTCCLLCNSIKSGRSYSEAAADILEAVRDRRISSGSLPVSVVQSYQGGDAGGETTRTGRPGS